MLGAPAAPSAADALRLGPTLLPKPAPQSTATDLHAATSALSLSEFYLQTRTHPVFRSLPTQFSPSGRSSRGISCSLLNPIALLLTVPFVPHLHRWVFARDHSLRLGLPLPASKARGHYQDPLKTTQEKLQSINEALKRKRVLCPWKDCNLFPGF